MGVSAPRVYRRLAGLASYRNGKWKHISPLDYECDIWGIEINGILFLGFA
jgi:hypothetical protein